MSAVATIAARPSASSAWWRSIATAIRCGRFQRRASTPPTRAWSMPSCSRSSRRRCSGVRETGVEVDLVARVQAGDDEAADVVQQRRHGELVAFDPADDAADLVGGPLGGEGVDAEALGLQLPAAVGLEEVEAGRGAGDRQHAGGLQHLDRLGDAADAAGDDAAAVGEAQHGDRRARRRTRPPRRARRCERSRRSPRAITRSRDSIRTGKRSTASKASARRLPGAAVPREPLAVRPLAPFCVGGPCRCAMLALVCGRGGHSPPHRQLKTFGLAESTRRDSPGLDHPSSLRGREALERPFPACFSVSLAAERRQRLEDARARPSCR